MKKLANISPFLLLLVPVFIMMLFTFTTGVTNNGKDEDVALKSHFVKEDIIKIINPF